MIHRVDTNALKQNDSSRCKLAVMFEGNNSAVLLSYLQGHMGTAWVDDLEDPTVAQVVVGIFVYYAGDTNSNEAVELLYNLPEHILAITHSDKWKNKIELVHNVSVHSRTLLIA